MNDSTVYPALLADVCSPNCKNCPGVWINPAIGHKILCICEKCDHRKPKRKFKTGLQETYDKLVRQRIKCDAAGCDAAGTNEIKVNARKFGTVTLSVCPNCIGKFRE